MNLKVRDLFSVYLWLLTYTACMVKALSGFYVPAPLWQKTCVPTRTKSLAKNFGHPTFLIYRQINCKIISLH